MAKLPRGVPEPYLTKDGVYVCRFYVGTAPDGRRLTRTVSSKSWQTCISKAKILRDDIASGNLEDESRMKVSAWLDYWIDTIAKPRVRPRVWEVYKSAIRNNVTPHIGGRPLKDLKPADVRAMHKAIIEAGKSTRTAEIAHNILGRALRDAKSEGLVKDNVCEIVDKPKVIMNSRGSLTSDEARAVLTTAAKYNTPLAARWAMALLTGSRQGECLGLTWDRVDFDNNLIDISWQLQRVPSIHGCGPKSADGTFPCGKAASRTSTCPQRKWDVGPGFMMIDIGDPVRALTLPKTTRSIRYIPMIAPLAAALKEHKERSEPNRYNLVWVGENGRPVGAAEDSEAWADALAAASAPKVPLHAARHTTASLLLEAGVPIEVIAQILGHSSILITAGYAHLNQDTARAALGKLDNLIQIA
ncbi:tyrosine-type recombinase/integrase [Rhodococcus qingshengii]